LTCTKAAAGMVPWLVPFKIVSDSHALHPRWPLLIKIEISSNGQNCFILSQNVSKFELYKHNDEDKVWLKLAKWFLTRRFLNDFLFIYA
jgi:hypothetical protein